MEFDWLDVSFSLAALPPKDIEESFEDPFSLKLLPDGHNDEASARYYCLGKSLTGKAVFSVFWTDGKRYRVIYARPMTQIESDFYERKKAEEI
ncbi:MAG: BrnT family toxin [Verrucomicrobiaceae bacterium]|nr:BrnT family toxin [Verrucomicrobiaceae bacterium]